MLKQVRPISPAYHAPIDHELCGKGPFVLWGKNEIGAYLRVDRNAVLRYIKQGLVCYKTPKRDYMTSTTLIDSWIVKMRKTQLKEDLVEARLQEKREAL